MKVSTFIDLTITKPQLFWSSQCQEIKTEKTEYISKQQTLTKVLLLCYSYVTEAKKREIKILILNDCEQ